MECKKCGRLLKPGMVKCPKCRALVDSVEPAKICPLCKRQGEPGDEICGFCDIELIYQFQVDVSPASDESQNPTNDSAGQHPGTVPSGIYIQNSQLDAELEHQRRLVQLRESVTASMQGEDYISAEGYLSEYLVLCPKDIWAEDKLTDCRLKQKQQREAEQVCLELKHKGTESKCEQLKSQIESLIDKRKWDEARQLLLDEYGKLNADDENWSKKMLSEINMALPRFIPLDMVFVKGGSFMMGGGEYSREKPVHRLELDSFYTCKYPVTFSEYDKYCEEAGVNKPKDEGWGRESQPVVNVSWYAAVRYCNWLSIKHNLTPYYSVDGEIDPGCWKTNKIHRVTEADLRANGYRLPTEAEWEYAARGGNKSRGYKYSGSNDINEVGWHFNSFGRRNELFNEDSWKTQPVGRKKANELGIYDMTGNIQQWCWDCFDTDYYSISPDKNPRGPERPEWGYNRTRRVLRGCSVKSYSKDVSYRGDREASRPDRDIGFRIFRNLDYT